MFNAIYWPKRLTQKYHLKRVVRSTQQSQSRIYREANMSRENLLDLLGGLMRGGVPDSGEDYITQLEDSIHLGDLTSANLTFFMRNVKTARASTHTIFIL